MNLKQFQEKNHIRRIDFDKVKPSGKETEYGSDELICPYCGQHDFCELENYEDYLNGTPYQCCNCGKYFYAEAELSINTTCIPMEEKVISPLTRKEIENRYEIIWTFATKRVVNGINRKGLLNTKPTRNMLNRCLKI